MADNLADPFYFCRSVYPKLYNFLASANFMNIFRGPFAVNNSHACIHPLHATGVNNMIVSTTIPVVNSALEHKGYR